MRWIRVGIDFLVKIIRYVQQRKMKGHTKRRIKRIAKAVGKVALGAAVTYGKQKLKQHANRFLGKHAGTIKRGIDSVQQGMDTAKKYHDVGQGVVNQVKKHQ